MVWAAQTFPQASLITPMFFTLSNLIPDWSGVEVFITNIDYSASVTSRVSW